MEVAIEISHSDKLDGEGFFHVNAVW